VKSLRHPFALLGLLVVAVAVIAGSLAVGSVSVSLADVWRILIAEPLQSGAQAAGADTAATVIREIRLPRTLAGFLVGAALGLAGAKMQVLIRNPLADPYILGISGGAAVGALSALMLSASPAATQLAAAAGAIGSMMIVLGLGRGVGTGSSTRLLLTGVVVAAGWGAIVSFLLAIGPVMKVRGMLFWLMGDLSHARPGLLITVLVVVGLLIGIGCARSMNLLAGGSLHAASLGVDVRRTRLLLYLSASVLTAGAVTVAGSIGFVGLVVPHIMRIAGGADHRWVVPASAIGGGALVVFADMLARTLLAPQQLPVGVLTAFAGVPIFLFILSRNARNVQ